MRMNVNIPAEYVLQNAILILLSVNEDFEYKDGKKTDIHKGYRYQVVETNNYDKIVVKIPSSIPVITNEQLQNKEDKTIVTFENCMARPYRSVTGEYDLSFTASDIIVVK